MNAEPTDLHSRRRWLASAGSGFGVLALTALLTEGVRAADSQKAPNPLAPKTAALHADGEERHLPVHGGRPEPHRPVRSQAAAQRAGRPAAAAELQAGHHGDGRDRLAAAGLASASGSSTARAACGSPTGCRTSPTCADDLAVIRSCWADGLNHSAGVCQMNTGSILGGRPSLGAWVSYGLGTENQNLPAFVVLQDNAGAGGQRPAQLGHRLHAGRLPGHAHRRRQRADPEPRPRPTGVSDDAAARQARLPRPAQPPPRRSRAASRPSSTPASPATSWPSACRPRRPRRSTSRRRPTRRKTLYGLDDKETADVRPQLPARPAAGRARRAVRAALSRRRQQVGRPRRASRRTTPSSAARSTSRSPACSRT